MFEQSQRAWFRLAQAAKRPFLPWFGAWGAKVAELRAVGSVATRVAGRQRGRPGASGGGSVAAREAALDALGPRQRGGPGASGAGSVAAREGVPLSSVRCRRGGLFR